MNKRDWLRKKLNGKERLSILKRVRENLDKEISRCYNKETQGVEMKDVFEAMAELSVEELEQAKEKVSELIKARKEQVRLEREQAFKNTVSVGDEILFVFKGEEHFGKVAKINEKSFTAEFDLDGETVKKPIKFHFFVGRTSEGMGTDEEDFSEDVG